MLNTEDIDDDYFTPASSTSLANIFGKPRKDVSDNETLKYTPPKPSLSQTPNAEEQKATQCILACALLGYEWSNGSYIARGKLGFAILKILKSGLHNIILYDSNKVTLSNMTISANFKVTVKENVYFSYLDNLQKYWCLYASEEEMKKIINLLNNLNAMIIYSSNDEKEPPEITKTDTVSAIKETPEYMGKGSDTDSMINRKTKMSILNRMANMGQSVLPTRTISTEKTSDSSDTNETNDYKSVRHKPIKVIAKRTRSDKNTSESQSLVEAHKIVFHSTEHSSDVPLFTYVNGQIVPVMTKSDLVSTSSTSTGIGSDINVFISEQRVNNSELRINLNRVSDKVEQVFNKICDIQYKENVNGSNIFQMEIMQKLLSEYENKIKVYEDFIKNNNLDKNAQLTQVIVKETHDETVQSKTDKDLKDKIKQLELLCQEKDTKISKMEMEISLVQKKHEEEIDKERRQSDKLSNEVQCLNHAIGIKNEELNTLIKYKNQAMKTLNENDLSNKIKNIMNDTFNAISESFDTDESYSGATVKNVTASIIKKITIESLSTI